ncbi:MAG: hypothetical protein PWP37_1330 [Thermotogota bacterium]|nr:hypothetical protein [Thermotogota bacterium]MDK2865138.1 hypothetical protein [Thermotogota bacterium]
MKILLINPWICDVAAYDFWMKPLGILYVGAILERLGVEVELIDLTDRFLPELRIYLNKKGIRLRETPFGSGKFYSEEIEKPAFLSAIPRRFKRYGLPVEIVNRLLLRKLKDADAVFMTSGMTYWYWGIIETMKVLRAHTNIPVVLGGIYVNLIKEHAEKTAKESGINHVVNGHGMDAVSEALGLIGRNDLLAKSWSFDWFEDTSPAYHLYEHPLPYAVLLASIGCNFRCTYCSTPRLWGGLRSKSVDSVIRDLEKVLELGVETVAFYDDAFLLHPQLNELLERLRRYRDRVSFILPNGIHARFLDSSIARALKEAGFRLVYLGLETSGRLQKTTGGKVTDEEFCRAVKLLKEAGFERKELKAYIMVNLPGQTKEDVENAAKLCEKLDIGYSLNEYTPIPGTPDWVKLQQKGDLPKNVDPLLLNNSILPYWWKKGMDVQTIQSLKVRKSLSTKL